MDMYIHKWEIGLPVDQLHC